MGGNKKKSTASSDKTVSTGPVAEAKKDNKEGNIKTEDKGKQKQRLSVFVEEDQGRKALQAMKAITVQGLARAIGVKISVANGFIKSLESKGMLENVGGHSGHRVYKLVK